MQELWIKKTVYRRYLILDEDIEEVKAVLKNGTAEDAEIIRDFYDRNKNFDYDEEKYVVPFEFEISAAANESTELSNCNKPQVSKSIEPVCEPPCKHEDAAPMYGSQHDYIGRYCSNCEKWIE